MCCSLRIQRFCATRGYTTSPQVGGFVGDKRGNITSYRRFAKPPDGDTGSTDLPFDVTCMARLSSILRNSAMRLYLLGQLIILFGAWLMDLTQSMVPMALAASAALMLMTPLLRLLIARFMAARQRDPDRR